MKLKLSDDEIKQIDEVSALPSEYPGWMVPFQALDRLDPSVQRYDALNKK